jgi:hypothetical protein
LTKIAPDFNKNSPLLSSIDLRHNNITSLSAGTFALFGSRRPALVVNLSNNSISQIAPGAFSDDGFTAEPGVHIWGQIVLANNLLTKLDRAVFEPLIKTDYFVDVTGNPLVCDCESLRWILDGGYVTHLTNKWRTDICGSSILYLNHTTIGCA